MMTAATFRESIATTIDRFLNSGTPFALYALPDSEPVLVEQGKAEDSFILCPWAQPSAATLTISSAAEPAQVEAISTPKDEYLAAIAEVATDHAERGGGKTVISRIICGKAHRSFGEAARMLFSAFPHTLRYVCFSPALGGWMGATPEVLADINGCSLRTMALAGTKPVGSGDWDAKNLDEQAMVTDFIASTLRQAGAEVKVGERHSLTYGEIEHLCTEISASFAHHTDALAAVDLLNPTPAVCGSPRSEAMNRISRLESHSRRLYAGYICIRRPDESQRLFVNLRCANFDPASSQVCIYAGGGITAKSIPEAEWEETARKAAPLIEFLALQ